MVWNGSGDWLHLVGTVVVTNRPVTLSARGSSGFLPGNPSKSVPWSPKRDFGDALDIGSNETLDFGWSLNSFSTNRPF